MVPDPPRRHALGGCDKHTLGQRHPDFGGGLGYPSPPLILAAFAGMPSPNLSREQMALKIVRVVMLLAR